MKKKMLAGLAMGLFMFGMIGMAEASPIQWSSSIGGNDHWYEIVDSGGSGAWINAENNAKPLGVDGHLVTINDANEEAWLRITFGDDTRYWIGFSDSASEGNWIWSSGENVSYTHWDTGQPDNATPPSYGEDFAVLNWNTSSGAWNDWDHLRWDYSYISGIAEYSAVPIPATILLFGSGIASLAGIRLKRRKK